MNSPEKSSPDRDDQEPNASAGEVPRLAEHLFRHESGKLVSVLVGIFGIERLQLAEDVVQEALVRALRTWPYYGVPTNPAAWLTQTAKNLALDVLRRETLFHSKQPEISFNIEQKFTNAAPEDSIQFTDEIQDDRLRLMFVCCHPLIPSESQTALALKTLGGFSPAEIAKAYLTTEAAIAKRLTRARQRIQELGIPFEIPAAAELPARLNSVLQTLYLMFNEGYKASSGPSLVRKALCLEAIRLGRVLVSHPAGHQPRAHALLALMLLNAARLSTRTTLEGQLLRLQDQDRSQWDQAMITQAMGHLAQSAAGQEISSYHLQAAIAACHCAARDYASTPWPQILSLYDQLAAIDESPIIALNRAVALAQVQGPRAGIEAIQAIPNTQSLDSYHLYYAVLAELEMQSGDFQAAAIHFQKALQLTSIQSEQSFLLQKLETCTQSCRI